MIKNLLLTTFIGAIITIGFNGCMEGPAGPTLSGSISGYVTLVNANGSQPFKRDGIEVSVSGSTKTATTDSTGKWVLNDINTGTYTISFSKSGYGNSKVVQLQFAGGNDKNLGNIYLCAPPAFSISNLKQLSLNNNRSDSTSIYLGFNLSDSSINGLYRTFLMISPDTNLSITPSLHSFGIFVATNFANGIDSTNIRLTPANFISAGFTPGDTLYVAAFSANQGNNNSGYLDTLTGKNLFTNINSLRSNMIQFVVPKFISNNFTGSLNGSVILVDANGGQHSKRDSVKISIEGTNFFTWSDTNGNWILPSVKNGSYVLSFSKNGYGLSKSNVNETNGSAKNLGVTYLCQPPAFSINTLSVLPYNSTRNDSTLVYISTQLSDLTIQGLYRVYFVMSIDSNFSELPNPNTFGLFFNSYFHKGLNTTDVHLTPTILAGAGFQSGDTLYAKAFLANAGGINSSYPDSLSGKPIYTNINAKGSNLLKFAVP